MTRAWDAVEEIVFGRLRLLFATLFAVGVLLGVGSTLLVEGWLS